MSNPVVTLHRPPKIPLVLTMRVRCRGTEHPKPRPIATSEEPSKPSRARTCSLFSPSYSSRERVPIPVVTLHRPPKSPLAPSRNTPNPAQSPHLGSLASPLLPGRVLCSHHSYSSRAQLSIPALHRPPKSPLALTRRVCCRGERVGVGGLVAAE